MGIFDEGYGQQEQYDVFNLQAPKPEWEWSPLERIKASTEESVGALYGMGSALFDVVGLEGASDWSAKKAGDWFEDAQSRDIVRTSFTEIQNPLDAGKWATEVITSFIPDIAMMLAGGAGVGTAAAKLGGSTIGKQLVKSTVRSGFKKNLLALETKAAKEGLEVSAESLYRQAAKDTARDAGRLLGVSTFEGGQAAGQAFLTDVEERGDDASGIRALGVGAATTAISMLNPLNKMLAGKKGGSVLGMTIGEAAEETSQEAVMMAHEAGIDPNKTFGELVSTEEGIMRLVESGVAGSLLGGTFGGGIRKFTSPPKVAPVEEDILTEVTTAPEKILEEAGIPVKKKIEVGERLAELRVPDEARGLYADIKYEPPVPTTAPTPIPREVAPVPKEEVYEPELPTAQRQAIADAEKRARVQELIDEEARAKQAAGMPERLEAPQWVTDPEMVRKTRAAAEIRDTEFSEFTNDVATIQAEIKKEPTKLKDKQEKKVSKAKAKKVILEAQKGIPKPTKAPTVPFEKEVITEVPEVIGPDVTIEPTLAEETAEIVKIAEGQEEVLATRKKGKTTGDWVQSSYEVEGKTVSVHETKDGKGKIAKISDKKWILMTEEGRKIENPATKDGTFPNAKTAKEAYRKDVEGVEPEVVKEKETIRSKRAAKPLTKPQMKRIEDLQKDDGIQKVLDKTRRNAESAGRHYDESVAMEGIVDAAKTYKPKTHGTFASYTANVAQGRIQEYNKAIVEGREVQPIVVEGKEAVIAEDVIAQATKEAVREPVQVVVEKKKEEKPKPEPVKKISVEELEIQRKKAEAKTLAAKEVRRKAAKAEQEKIKEAATAKAKVEKIEKEEVSEAITTIRRRGAGPTTEVIIPTTDVIKYRGKTSREVAMKALERAKGDKAEAIVTGRLVTADAPSSFRDKVVKQIDSVNYFNISTVVDSIKRRGEPNSKIVALATLVDKAIPEGKRNIKVIVDPGARSALYNPKTNTVILTNHLDKATGLHEVVHAVTVREMDTNKELRKGVEDLYDTVKQSIIDNPAIPLNAADMRAIKSAEGTSKAFKKTFEGEDFGGFREVAYAMLNTKEFLSQTFSSETFQSILQNIEVPKSQRTSLVNTVWDAVVNLVRKAFGKPKIQHNAFDRILKLTAELAKVRVPEDYVAGEVSLHMADKPSKDDWTKRAKELRKHTAEKTLIQKVSEGREGVKRLMRDVLKSSSEVLRKIDPKLIKFMRKYEMDIVERNVKARDEIKEFVQGFRKLSVDDRNLLSLTLKNNKDADLKKRDEILRKNGLTSAFKKVEEMNKGIYEEKKTLGLNQHKEQAGYFPRRVKDMDGLMKAIYEDPDMNYVQAELRDLKGKEEREHAVKQMVQTGRFPAIAFIRDTSGKKRSIKRVSSKWDHYYEDTPEALLAHVYENNELIAGHGMFMDTPARMKEVKRRDSLYNQLEGKKEGKDRDRMVAELQYLEEALNNPERQFEGLDTFLVKEAPELSTEDTKAVLNVIRARLNQKGMHGPLATMRNVSLMSALGNPTSAITQIGDLAFSFYKNGPKHTVQALLGKSIIMPKDLDLEHSMKEFQTEGSAKWLDKVLTISGLKGADMFFKKTSIGASLRKAKSQSFEVFKKDWEHALGEDTEQTYKDIKADRNTGLSRYFVFNDLSNWQPISLSEMPVKYLEAGNGRIFYALKSYNIKAINSVYRESVHAWRTSKTQADRAKAAKNVGYLVLLMTMAGATADELKDLLLGKEKEFSDNVQDNLLKIAFLSRYTLDKGIKGGMVTEILRGVLIPPTGFVDEPMKDIYKTFGKGEPSWKSIQQLPWGKIPYQWLAEEAETKKMEDRRKKIFARVVGGDSPSTVRKDINEYNRWARERGMNPITMGSISRAIKKRRKEELS